MKKFSFLKQSSTLRLFMLVMAADLCRTMPGREQRFLPTCQFDPDVELEYDAITRCMQRDPAFSNGMEIRNHTIGSDLEIRKLCENDPLYRRGDKTYISLLSLSPWKWVKNIDENRTPREIVEAECLCDNCINPSPPSNAEDPICYDLVSKPITAPFYFQTMSNGRIHWLKHQVQIGCTCAFPEYQDGSPGITSVSCDFLYRG